MNQLHADLRRLPVVGYSAAFLAAAAIVAELSGVSIAYATFMPVIVVGLSLAATWTYTSVRRMPTLQAICEVVLTWKLVIFGVLFFTYATARPAYPLMDPVLARADELIGFDVPAVVGWIDQNWLLSTIFEVTYHTFGPQLLLIPILLSITGRSDAAARMFLAFVLICVISSVISVYVPAVEAFAHFGMAMSDFKNLSGSDGYRFHPSFFAVREQDPFVLTLGMTSGIVSFPSIHAAGAILCGYAAWQINWLRYPALVLNILMYLATVPVGAHYAVEVLGGTVVGCAVIWAVYRADVSAYRRRLWMALPSRSYASARSV